MRQATARDIDKHKYAQYLRKASSFYQGMKKAEENEDWNLAALNAIHCVISSADAVTTFYLGQHSAGQRHEDVIALLGQTRLPGIEEKARQILDVLRLKTLVEYEPEEPTENEARAMAKQAERIFKWARDSLERQQTA